MTMDNHDPGGTPPGALKSKVCYQAASSFPIGSPIETSLAGPVQRVPHLTRSHKVPQGFTRSHKVSQGLSSGRGRGRGRRRRRRRRRSLIGASPWTSLGKRTRTKRACTIHPCGTSIDSCGCCDGSTSCTSRAKSSAPIGAENFRAGRCWGR